MAKKITSVYQTSLILDLAAMSLYFWQESYQPIKHKLHVDNWFNSIPPSNYMFGRGIEMVGTVRSNRIGKLPIMSVSEMKKKGRGYFTAHLSNIDGVDTSVVSSFDNKVVTLLSNFVGSEPSTQVRRFQ